MNNGSAAAKLIHNKCCESYDRLSIQHIMSLINITPQFRCWYRVWRYLWHHNPHDTQWPRCCNNTDEENGSNHTELFPTTWNLQWPVSSVEVTSYRLTGNTMQLTYWNTTSTLAYSTYRISLPGNEGLLCVIIYNKLYI